MGSFDPHISEDVVAVVASSVERMSLLRQVDLLSFVMGEGRVLVELLNTAITMRAAKVTIFPLFL